MHITFISGVNADSSFCIIIAPLEIWEARPKLLGSETCRNDERKKVSLLQCAEGLGYTFILTSDITYKHMCDQTLLPISLTGSHFHVNRYTVASGMKIDCLLFCLGYTPIPIQSVRQMQDDNNRPLPSPGLCCGRRTTEAACQIRGRVPTSEADIFCPPHIWAV